MCFTNSKRNITLKIIKNNCSFKLIKNQGLSFFLNVSISTHSFTSLGMSVHSRGPITLNQVLPLVVRRSSPSCTRDVFENSKKYLFHRNSHTEKRGNVNLAQVHFILLLNCNTCKYVRMCIVLTE